jgi:hypothetical protein
MPWFAAGSLDPNERAVVEQHLGQCAECRSELAFQRRLRAQYVGSLAVADCKPALDRLLSRLESENPQPAGPGIATAPGPIRASWRSLPRWTVTVLAMQVLTVVVLGYSLVRVQPPAGAYRALSAGPAKSAARGNVVVRVAPATPEAELRRILRTAGARLVDGPLANGGYVLDIPEDQLPAALAGLRNEPAVRLVESLRAPPAP